MKGLFKTFMPHTHKLSKNANCDALCKQVAQYLHIDNCLLLDEQHNIVGGFGEKSKNCFTMPVDVGVTASSSYPPASIKRSTFAHPSMLWSNEAKCFPKNLLQNLGDMIASACLSRRMPVAICRTDEQGWPIVLCDESWAQEIGSNSLFWADLQLPGIGAIDPSARFRTSVIKQDTFRIQLTSKRGKQIVTVLLSPAGHEIPIASKTPAHYIAKAVMIAKTPDPRASQSSRVFESGRFVCPFPDCLVVDKIGRGSYGVVYKANRVGYGQIALKVTRVGGNVDENKMVQMEHALATGLNHPNIVEMYDHRTVRVGSAWETWFMLEYCENGPVSLRFKNNAKVIPSILTCMEECKNISSGMGYLHSKNIIHGDLTAANVLVDRTGTCKITDFGISRMLISTDVRTESYGTVTYMPQELLAHKKIGLYTDVYSFGVLMWEIRHVRRAWESVLPTNLFLGKIAGTLELEWEGGDDERLESAYKHLCIQCMNNRYEARPTFTQITQILTEILKSHDEVS